MGTHPIFESDFDCLTEKMNMEECNICGRNFNQDALQRHRPICAKNANKQPRKQFNSQKNRINGTEINYTEVKRAEKRKPTVKELRTAEKKNLWRQKHEDFIQSVRAAKGVDDYDAGGGHDNHNSGYNRTMVISSSSNGRSNPDILIAITAVEISPMKQPSGTFHGARSSNAKKGSGMDLRKRQRRRRNRQSEPSISRLRRASHELKFPRPR